jgi:hypothetical protein
LWWSLAHGKGRQILSLLAHGLTLAESAGATVFLHMFGKFVSKKDGGSSAFSKSKTMREQREYLPAFAVREDLMRGVAILV